MKRHLLLLAAALLSSAALAPGAQATFPGPAGDIALGGTAAAPGVFLASPAETQGGLRPLAADGFGAAWSPDGARIAFGAPPAPGSPPGFNENDIFSIDASGANRRGLARSVTIVTKPAWSPDAAQIAYDRQTPPEFPGRTAIQGQVLAANVPFTEADPTPGAGDISPNWSPNGDQIAFTRIATGGGTSSIMTTTPAPPLGTPRTLTTGNLDGAPNFSPDGSQIVFQRGSPNPNGTGTPAPGSDSFGIFVMNADGTGERRVATGRTPVWSPDQTQLAYIRGGSLYVSDTDGARERQVQVVPVTTSTIDWGPRREQPVLEKSVVTRVVRGTVKVRLRGSNRFVDLSEIKEIPLGAEFDTTKGTVAITAARDKKGRLQSTQFYDGRFVLSQTGGSKPVLGAKLSGPLTGCGRARGSAGGNGPGRSLWGKGKGRVKTEGNRGSATTRATEWLTKDNCDGSTSFRVDEGSIEVRDSTKRKTVILKRGQRYTARGR